MCKLQRGATPFLQSNDANQYNSEESNREETSEAARKEAKNDRGTNVEGS